MSRKELFAHYHYKWTTQNLLLSKLVNIQLCISTHDKECIKLHKHSKGLVVSILSQMRGRSDTRREWMYENERRRKFTSACRILNCFKVEYVWIEHVDVLGHVYGNIFAVHILVFMSLLKIILTMIMHFYVWFLSYLHPLFYPWFCILIGTSQKTKCFQPYIKSLMSSFCILLFPLRRLFFFQKTSFCWISNWAGLCFTLKVVQHVDCS